MSTQTMPVHHISSIYPIYRPVQARRLIFYFRGAAHQKHYTDAPVAAMFGTSDLMFPVIMSTSPVPAREEREFVSMLA